MRVAIVITILMIVSYTNIEARNLGLSKHYRRVVKTINKNINSKCNKIALKYVNNTRFYDCFLINSSNTCKKLDNYTDYIKVKNNCLKKNNSKMMLGIVLGFVIMVFMSIGLY